MKIGFIVESTQEGPEHKAIRLVMQCFSPRDSYQVFPQGQKGNLLRNAAAEAVKILEAGLDRVFILWDWHPAEVAWKTRTRTPRYQAGDCIVDSITLWKRLKQTKHAAVGRERIVLVCIPQELEAWCLADHAALRSVLEQTVRGGVRVRTQRYNNPESVPFPEDTLDDLFRNHRLNFDKFVFTPAILEAASETRFARLACCPSFVRLVENLTGREFAEVVAPPPPEGPRRNRR